MGPSKEYAYLVGEEIFEEVLKLLESKHVTAPHEYLNAIRAENQEQQTTINTMLVASYEREKAEWDEHTKQLKELLCEMVWANHANGF